MHIDIDSCEMSKTKYQIFKVEPYDFSTCIVRFIYFKLKKPKFATKLTSAPCPITNGS